MGTHQAPVSCIATDDEAMPHMVVTGSWDKTVAVWDLRASRRAHEIVLPEKVLCLSLRHPHCLIGTATPREVSLTLTLTLTPILTT